MDWCGSSTPRTPEYRTMNEERHERKAYWLVIVRPQFLIGGDTKGLCPSIPWLDRNKVQVYRSVRMPQLHTSLHFHLTPIVMINGSSRRDLLLNSQNFCRSIPAGAENPSLSWLCYRRLRGSRNRRALILGWAYYLDAFSSYPLRTWLPSVYRGHDNWYTRGVSPHTWSYDFAETCVFGKQSPGPGHCDPLCEEAPLLPKLRGYFAEFLRESCLAPLGILYLPTCVGFGYRYPFVEGRSSFSWEYGMGYFSAVAPGTRTLARGIFSTPSYPEKAGSPYVLEPITIFRLT
ncbi:hypothetical protein ACET3Z_032045 [Daucus carota]